MSHFTHLKTRFQNFSYLEKAIKKIVALEIKLSKQSRTNNPNIVISQTNGYDISFIWNGNEYELVTDLSFWAQSIPATTFVNKVAQQYAYELIIGEGKKTGFQPFEKEQLNISEGSKVLVLERWSTK